jgi:ABC-type dipeptide/oligopeptide/nickel transport system ATPase component
MLIGINGKIGSGKDTIGSIMQCLMNHPKISNTDLLYIINNNIVSETSKCEIKKFAGKLKQIASLLTGIPVENFEDQEFKKALLDAEWGTVQQIPLNSIPPFADMQFNVMMSVREFLQRLGTEAMRDGLHENVWVNALFADYKHSKTCNCKKGCRCAHDLPNWIITDMRFPNELEAVVERKGITIRVVSPFIRFSDGSYRAKSKMMGDFDNEHASEIALDDAEFDYEIINDGTIEDLVEKVREILIKEQII